MVVEERDVDGLDRLVVVVAQVVTRAALSIDVVVIERETQGQDTVHLELDLEALDERGFS